MDGAWWGLRGEEWLMEYENKGGGRVPWIGLQSNKSILRRVGEPGLQVAVENKYIIDAVSL